MSAFQHSPRPLILACLLAIAALAAYRLETQPPGPPIPAAAAANGALAVFFTTPELVYPDLPEARRPPGPERALVADLDRASTSVELASFEYGLDSIAAALARAGRRGVRVRLALDRESLHNPSMARWAGIVEQAGGSVSWEESDAFLHSKFVIVDGQIVWTGSWNPTVNDTYRNNNNLIRIALPELVANYRAEFERMAGGAFGKGKAGLTPNPLVRAGSLTVENAFSPREPVRELVVARIAAARERIEVLAFAFTDDTIAAALAERAAAGVPVRVVFEARNIQGTGSAYGPLRAAGVEVVEDGNCYTMHHKVIVIDGQTVIAGSYNFTARAEELNDENTLIIDDPAIAAAYGAEFARVYAQARNPLRCLD